MPADEAGPGWALSARFVSDRSSSWPWYLLFGMGVVMRLAGAAGGLLEEAGRARHGQARDRVHPAPPGEAGAEGHGDPDAQAVEAVKQAAPPTGSSPPAQPHDDIGR